MDINTRLARRPFAVAYPAIAAGASNEVDVTWQVKDASGKDYIDGPVTLLVQFSDAATGAGQMSATFSGTAVVGDSLGLIMATLTAKKLFLCQTTAQGRLRLTITDTANEPFYPAVWVWGQSDLPVVGRQVVAGDYA